MKNIMQMMQKAQKIQQQMEEIKNEIKAMSFSASSGGGLVTVHMNGNYEIQKIDIDNSLIDVEEKEMLSDLIAAAYNEVRRKVDETSNEKMKELTSGLPLPPGMNFPF